MKKNVIYLIVLICTTFHNIGFAQKRLLTDHEQTAFTTFNNLIQFVSEHPHNKAELNILFDKFIYFDYVLKDSSKMQTQRRVQLFDDLFLVFRSAIDSIGERNIDALPIRFFQDDSIVYAPFTRELKENVPNIFVYFNKQYPNKPIGFILFEEKTHKILSWILINQGGKHYFLTFNLL